MNDEKTGSTEFGGSGNDNGSELEPKPKKKKKKKGGMLFRIWQSFWILTLFVSLGYAWYCFYVPGNRIVWADSFASAQRVTAESGKPMILFFTGKWCVPCRIMKRTVWADEEVESMVKLGFTPVLVDVDKPESAEILNQFPILGTPTTLIAGAEGEVLEQIAGGIDKANFISLLTKWNKSNASTE